MTPNYANWSGNIIIDGPNDNPQRVWVMTAMKTAVDPQGKPALTYDANADLYTFTFPTATGEPKPGWPAAAQLPLNTQPAMPPVARQVNVAGSYTLWMYFSETLRPAAPNIRNTSWRDVANFETSVRFGSDGSAPMRQVVSEKSCDSCHVVTQAHGGSRQEPHVCFTCHTRGAEDQGVLGTRGAKCTTATQASDCAGYNSGTQACQDTNNDAVADTCVVIKDATPNQSIDFSVMIHQIHFARKLEGYNQRNNIPYKGKLQINTSDLSEKLFPMDVRNCTKCHGNSDAKCDADNPCGYGQSCLGGTCQNVAYLNPSTRVCLSCHDTGPAYAHAALNTWSGPDGPLEACQVCHGDSGEFSVTRAHNISNPYVPPYSRSE